MVAVNLIPKQVNCHHNYWESGSLSR